MPRRSELPSTPGQGEREEGEGGTEGGREGRGEREREGGREGRREKERGGGERKGGGGGGEERKRERVCTHSKALSNTNTA